MSQPEIGRSIVAGGIATNYHDHGAGPPLLLIHGSGPGVSAWANWSRNIPVLSQDFRVIAPDLVGFGYSTHPAGAVDDKSVWVRQVIGLLDALEIDKISVLGNSFGGAIALALMIAHPDRVHRAVLMGSVGLKGPVSDALDFLWSYTPSLENMREAIGKLAYDESRITDELVQMRHEAAARPEAHRSYAATFGGAPRQRALDMLSSEEADIGRIAHEVLILHGAFDKVIPLQTSIRLHQLIRNSDLHSFAGCGHWVQIERAASFNRLVRQFVDQGLVA
ncbi:MAG: alpha/beta hydrolase [Hyphomonadaceae bacterium]|nr:alpha/beta hydrolase [Hyphomonadaceae bacterium]